MMIGTKLSVKMNYWVPQSTIMSSRWDLGSRKLSAVFSTAPHLFSTQATPGSSPTPPMYLTVWGDKCQPPVSVDIPTQFPPPLPGPAASPMMSAALGNENSSRISSGVMTTAKTGVFTENGHGLLCSSSLWQLVLWSVGSAMVLTWLHARRWSPLSLSLVPWSGSFRGSRIKHNFMQ